jgi:hypothetical protein
MFFLIFLILLLTILSIIDRLQLCVQEPHDHHHMDTTTRVLDAAMKTGQNNCYASRFDPRYIFFLNRVFLLLTYSLLSIQA